MNRKCARFSQYEGEKMVPLYKANQLNLHAESELSIFFSFFFLLTLQYDVQSRRKNSHTVCERDRDESKAN